MGFIETVNEMRDTIQKYVGVKDTVKDFLNYVDSKDEAIREVLGTVADAVPYQPFKNAVSKINEHEPKILNELLKGIRYAEEISMPFGMSSEQKLEKAVKVAQANLPELEHTKFNFPESVSNVVNGINVLIGKIKK